MHLRFSSVVHAPRSILNSFSQIFLQTHQGCGLLILVAIGFNDLWLLCAALIGVLAGTVAAWCCGYPREDVATGLYGYNAALLGLLINSLLGFSPLSILLTAALCALSSPLQHRLLERRRERDGLPGFTLPFVLFGWLMLCAPMEGSAVSVLTERNLDGWHALEGVLRGVAQVVLLSDPVTGLCLFIALLIADRRAALWTLCGSAVGVYIALLTGTAQPQALAGMASYNPALAALALSQVHRSPVLPALGIALAVIGWIALDRLGIPPLTMPFILACWAVALCTAFYQRHPALQPA